MTPREQWQYAIDCLGVLCLPPPMHPRCRNRGVLAARGEHRSWKRLLRAWERVDASARGWRATLRVRRERRALRRAMEVYRG